ncbi:MAG: pyridoxamine 5'-phosphate oxidase family protein [Hyphomicrobium sp.]|jgi:hypothetical protein
MLDPFHSGELEVQERTGERGRAVLNGRLIASAIPEGARKFLAQQSYCVVGWASPNGEIWASLLTARAGFASTDAEGATLALDFSPASGAAHAIPPLSGPPLSGMREGDHLGLLFIELATRRRLRVNGRVTELASSGLRLSVSEAFPNCPKYIQRREAVPSVSVEGEIEPVHGERLSDELTAWIAEADTVFVTSAHPEGPVDSSHRGGNPGFIKLEGEVLRIPDYPGNSMFGTLGNFAVNPRAGLVFVDFRNNRQLQLAGDVQLDLEAGDSSGETGGTGRWWTFSPRRWIVSSLSPSFTWQLIDGSPFNP